MYIYNIYIFFKIRHSIWLTGTKTEIELNMKILKKKKDNQILDKD